MSYFKVYRVIYWMMNSKVVLCRIPNRPFICPVSLLLLFIHLDLLHQCISQFISVSSLIISFYLQWLSQSLLVLVYAIFDYPLLLSLNFFIERSYCWEIGQAIDILHMLHIMEVLFEWLFFFHGHHISCISILKCSLLFLYLLLF